MKHTFRKTIGFKIGIILSVFLLFLFLLLGGIFYYIHQQTVEIPKQEWIADCNLEIKEIEGRNVYKITPKELEQGEILLFYVHGGSYLTGISEDAWKFYQSLVKDLKCTIIIPDYPHLPKYTCQETLFMIKNSYQAIVEQEENRKVIIMGDSAGGGLAFSLVQNIAQEQVRVPDKTILISPWLDVSLTNKKIKQVEKKDTVLHKLPLQWIGKWYAGKEGTKNKIASPLYGEMEELKDVIVYTGTNDIFYPDIQVLEEKVKEKQIDIQIKKTKDANHNWILSHRQKEVARKRLSTSVRRY